VSAEICFGAVRHARSAPARHEFSYPAYFLRLPLSRLDQLARPLFGVNRFNLLAFHFRDHGARDGSHPLPWLRELLAREGVSAEGEVYLHTMPRVLGFVFNPVSFWHCHDVDGRLRAVLCEVHNTFGEWHNYLVMREDGGPIGADGALWARKVFHVSPFLPLRGSYRFRFTHHGAVHTAAVDYWEDGVEVLSTCLGGRAVPLSSTSLLRAFFHYPLMTLAVLARIHVQALRLWWKRVPFLSKPSPPVEETTR
jgi:DUF1365 family protein